ncbi:MAG: replication-associated recombination protein A [Firmicutes bacterium]|nr:replication-associated recombination protein A [Bacillota bacterium]
MDDLFDFNNNAFNNAPLAERMRPRSLDEFLGQPHLIGHDLFLSRAIRTDRLGSCIFYGPPGTGKTSLAVIVANSTKGHYERLNAVSSGVADAKRVIDEARKRLKMYGRRTYLLLDECHRWNKAQSDCVLSAIEDGGIIFIGTTTENPYMTMTRAIVSRCRVFELKPLNEGDISAALRRAIIDKERGLGTYNITVSDDALDHIVWSAAGDLRNALNALELAVLSTAPDSEGGVSINKETAEQSIQRRSMAISESMFYDMLSAFCKSLRGSDADAALYWALRIIASGGDPLMIFRRIIAHASEDIGLADSSVLTLAVAAMEAYKHVGLPEGELPLAHAIIYTATAEKSNRVLAAKEMAKKQVEQSGETYVPLHLRNNNNTTFDKSDEPYLYPHDFGGYVKQQYLPDGVKGGFYTPSDSGDEKNVKRRLERIKARVESM